MPVLAIYAAQLYLACHAMPTFPLQDTPRTHDNTPTLTLSPLLLSVWHVHPSRAQGLWVAAATLVPAMQKGNETARLLHIAMNMINLGLFDGRSTPASASLSKLSSLATLLREGGGAGSEVGGGGSTSAVA